MIRTWMFGMLAAVSLLQGAEFAKVNPADWKFFNAEHEAVPDGMRIRIPTRPDKGYGSFGTYVDAGANQYLVVRMGLSESAAAAPWVGNASTGGRRIGALYPGWNTFRIADFAGKRFFLSFAQLGDRREKVGPWVDYRSFEFCNQPENGLTVTVKGKSPESPAKVGDTLEFRCYTSQPQPEGIRVRTFLAPQFVDVRFAREPLVLKAAGKGVYSAELTITPDATRLVSDAKTSVMAMASVDGTESYFTIPFPLEIETANAIPAAVTSAGSMQVRDDRQLWFDRTGGRNPASGKELRFVPAPDYSLTTDPADGRQLTDGKLTDRADDRIWFDRSAVGWYMTGGRILINIDLGQEEPVDKIVVRCLGGTTGNFKFPAQFECFVSRDGKLYYPAGAMQKLMPCESKQSDFKRYYYLPEDRPMPETRMYPFELQIDAGARYLMLKLTGATDAVFLDELAVIALDGKKDDAFNAAYRQKGVEIPMSGLLVRPRIAELALIAGVPAPQTFTIQDLRSAGEQKEPAFTVLELPRGMSVIGKTPERSVVRDGESYSRYVFPLARRGKELWMDEIFLAGAPARPELTARIYGRSGAADMFSTELPVRIVTLPEIKPFERLHISLSWMQERCARNWPDFFANWRKLGFNTVSTFPRFWNPNACANEEAFVAEARKQGFKIIMNDSAFHEMERGHKAGSEIFCQIPNLTHTMLCPSYQGGLYDKEMARVENCVRIGKPDYVFYDIECWHNAVKSAPRCTRCQEAMRKSGKPVADFLFECGDRQQRDLKAAVARGAKAAGIATPVSASYNRQMLHPIYAIEDFRNHYPALLEISQPSLYVAGRAADVRDTIRGNYKLQQNKKILPWLSTGCYGEFDSYKVEQMVLEALLNGASGVTYFQFYDFCDSPLDFYYHARALAAIRPYEDLVADGVPFELAADDPAMSCSALRKGGEMLLLLGNYAGTTPETTVKLPFKSAQIRDLRENRQERVGETLATTVPRGGIRLFYIKGEIRP